MKSESLNIRLDTYILRMFKVADDRDDVRIGIDWRTLDMLYITDRDAPGNTWYDNAHPSTYGHSLATPLIDAIIGPVVPEPTPALLVAFGLAALALRRGRTL